VVVGSPIYFDTVSAQLKLIIDRCNCVTPLIPQPGGGHKFVPLLERTRRAVFVTACAEHHRYDLAERTVRGFLKWVGAKWEETIAWVHADDDPGSVTRKPELVERARAVGRRLIESPPLEVPAAAP
jgi:multimeric flavodoxin WrbA